MSRRVVTSTYQDEALLASWLPKVESYHIPYTVYCKSDSLTKGQVEVVDDQTIQLPNYGRCDYAFLYHIINNYDTLDDYTLFVKNNWQGYGINLDKHLQLLDKYDYIESGVLRRYQYWTEEPGPHPRHETIYNGKHIYAETAIDWYREIFPGIKPPHVVCGWGHGPCFSVSKRLIQRHPKSVYEHLLNKFYPESNSWKSNGHPNQLVDVGKHYHDNLLRFWRVLFTHNVAGEVANEEPCCFTMHL